MGNAWALSWRCRLRLPSLSSSGASWQTDQRLFGRSVDRAAWLARSKTLCKPMCKPNQTSFASQIPLRTQSSHHRWKQERQEARRLEHTFSPEKIGSEGQLASFAYFNILLVEGKSHSGDQLPCHGCAPDGFPTIANDVRVDILYSYSVIK